MEEMLPFLGTISISFPIKQFPHHVEHHQSNGNIQKNASSQNFAIKNPQPTNRKIYAISELRYFVVFLLLFFLLWFLLYSD